jgi:hypothetical protein
MSLLELIDERVGAVLDFARVRSSALSSSLKSLLLSLDGAGTEDGSGTVGETPDEAVSTEHAAILYRPAAPDADGACEAIYLRTGDDVVVLATRDTRWQLSLEEGEVAVRAFGASAALVKLRTDGIVELGGVDLVELAAVASKVEQELDLLWDALSSHVHPAGTLLAPNGAVTGATAVTTTSGSAGSTGSEKVKVAT